MGKKRCGMAVGPQPQNTEVEGAMDAPVSRFALHFAFCGSAGRGFHAEERGLGRPVLQ